MAHVPEPLTLITLNLTPNATEVHFLDSATVIMHLGGMLIRWTNVLSDLTFKKEMAN
jgi:hypothetical protein